MGSKQHALERAGRVLAIIRAAADAGEKCPTNSEIANRVGYSSMSGPADAIHILESSGVISVQRGQASRVVTIMATGKSTAGTVKGVHHQFRPAPNDNIAAVKSDRNRLGDFAEAIANGATIQAAAKVADMSKREAAWSWAFIRRQLGAQAR